MKRIEAGAGEATLNAVTKKREIKRAVHMKKSSACERDECDVSHDKKEDLSPSTWSIHFRFLQLQEPMKDESEDLWEFEGTASWKLV